MKTISSLGLALALLGAVGCDTGPKGSAGFTLPDGDPEAGKAQFADHAMPDLPSPQDWVLVMEKIETTENK